MKIEHPNTVPGFELDLYFCIGCPVILSTIDRDYEIKMSPILINRQKGILHLEILPEELERLLKEKGLRSFE